MFLVLSLSALYFVVTGVQFWITQYINEILGVEVATVNKFYAITCFTAPIAGVFLSVLVYNCIGGYSSARALDLTALFAVFACLVTLPIPFVDTERILLFYLCIWLLFFFGSIILAPLVGIMLNQVKNHRRTTANSLATLFFNLFGYLPSPFIYGYFADKWPNDESFSMRVALGVTVYWSILAVIFLVLAYIFNLKKMVKQKESKKDKEDEAKPLGDSGGSGMPRNPRIETSAESSENDRSFQHDPAALTRG